MNINKSFATYMEDQGYGTFGDDLYIGGVPLEAPDVCWWIISGGGASEPKNTTGERQKRYIVSVFYRDIDTEEVYEKLQALEEEINSVECIDLDGYETVEAEATIFPADQDLDSEERTVGLLQVTLTIYQS